MKPALLLALPLALSIAAPALAASPKAEDPTVAMLTEPVLLDQLFAGFGASISKVDPSVVKIFVYREHRKDPYPELNNIIENRIVDELIRTNRFKVVECRECTVAHVVSNAKGFSYSNTIESNARLAQLASNLGVDGVLFWNTMGTGKNVIVNFQLVRANDGAIVWSKHFETDPDQQAREEAKAKAEEDARNRQSGLFVYTGFQGFNTTRTALPGANVPNAFVAQGLDIGLVLLRQSSFLDRFAYGLEGNFLQAGALNPALSIPVVSVGPYFSLALDPLLNRNSQDSVFNLYAGVGQSFILGQTFLNTFDFKGGLMFRFTPDLFLNLGFINITLPPGQTLTLSPDAHNQYEQTAKFGGFTYDVGVGMVFK